MKVWLVIFAILAVLVGFGLLAGTEGSILGAIGAFVNALIFVACLIGYAVIERLDTLVAEEKRSSDILTAILHSKEQSGVAN